MYPDSERAPVLLLPVELSEEAAAQTLEILYEIARAIENHYAAQIRRYRYPADPRQCQLWDETDPPF